MKPSAPTNPGVLPNPVYPQRTGLATRAVGPNDLPALMDLELTGFPAAQRWSERAWSEEVDGEDRLVRLAEATGPSVAGVIAIRISDVAELNRIVVDVDHRRQGIAQLLINEAAGRLPDTVDELWLEVAADNLPARKLYAGLGFSEIGRRRGYYPGGIDAVIMNRPVRDRTGTGREHG